jgi:histidinol-phosphatase (PHP family)
VDYGIKRDWDDPRGVEYRKDGPGETEREALANVDYPRYFKEIEELKRKYKDQIIIRAGLEFGIQTITIPQYDKLYSKYGDKLDFVLLSVHQVDNQELWTQDFQRGKTQEEYNRRYYEEILAVINQFKNYDVLAHLDLITRYDKNGIYPFEKVQDIIKEILKIIIAEGKGLELNTSSWRYGLSDTQPSRDILRLYKDLGGKYITLGSDAHTPEYMAAHFEDAKDILENEIGIYLLRIPDRR